VSDDGVGDAVASGGGGNDAVDEGGALCAKARL